LITEIVKRFRADVDLIAGLAQGPLAVVMVRSRYPSPPRAGR
jgi:hypothetical protein